MTLHIIVPCKSLAEGKSRLSPILGAGARKAICSRFLTNTLDVALSLVPTNRCQVVASDAGVESVIGGSGVAIIVDPGLGLNVALSLARDQIIRDQVEDFIGNKIIPYVVTQPVHAVSQNQSWISPLKLFAHGAARQFQATGKQDRDRRGKMLPQHVRSLGARSYRPKTLLRRDRRPSRRAFAP